MNRKRKTMGLKKENLVLKKADTIAHLVYQVTRSFPRTELFGITSQLRRSILSVPLNIIEGFARTSKKDHVRFLLIAYASLQEAKYLLRFAFKEHFLKSDIYEKIVNLCDEVSRMLWVKIRTLKSTVL